MPFGQNEGMAGFHGFEDLREISSSFIARLFSKIVWVCSVWTSTALQGWFQGGYALCGRVWFSVYCLESGLHLILTEKLGANAERLLRISFI